MHEHQYEWPRRGPSEHCRHSRGRRGLFRGFGRGQFGGPWMRAARTLASGDLQLIVLALLSEEPRHGYEIIKSLEEHSSGVYTPSPGMVYPALTYLDEMGYTTSEAEGAKKLYRITDSGAEHLKKNRASVDETLDHLARWGRRVAEFQKRFDEESEDAADVAGAGARSEWRQVKVELHQLRHELREALSEKRDAPIDESKRILAVLRRALEEIRTNK
jgi:DNA-binding PadR family transcriptional regulator